LDIDKILSELRSERDRIAKTISVLLDGVGLSGTSKGTAKRGRPPGRRKGITAEGRRRLSQAMKARWAARRTKPAAAAKATTGGKRRAGMSAAGRKRIAEAMRKRWAEKRKAAAQAGSKSQA